MKNVYERIREILEISNSPEKILDLIGCSIKAVLPFTEHVSSHVMPDTKKELHDICSAPETLHKKIILRSDGADNPNNGVILDHMESVFRVLGDTHGALYSSLQFYWDKIFNAIEKTGHYIIDGDLVDRGEHSVENVIFYFSLLLERPDKFTILRGNHETREMCGNECNGNTLYTQLINMFPEPLTTLDSVPDNEKLKAGNVTIGKYIFTQFILLFSYLPSFALTRDLKMMVVHGGLPPVMGVILEHDQTMRKVAISSLKQLLEPWAQDAMLWSDPCLIRSETPGEKASVVEFGVSDYDGTITTKRYQLREPIAPEEICFLPNKDRGESSFYFSQYAMNAVKELLDVEFLVRAHQFKDTAQYSQFIKNVWTVFSSGKGSLDSSYQDWCSDPYSLAIDPKNYTVSCESITYNEKPYTLMMNIIMHVYFPLEQKKCLTAIYYLSQCVFFVVDPLKYNSCRDQSFRQVHSLLGNFGALQKKYAYLKPLNFDISETCSEWFLKINITGIEKAVFDRFFGDSDTLQQCFLPAEPTPEPTPDSDSEFDSDGTMIVFSPNNSDSENNSDSDSDSDAAEENDERTEYPACLQKAWAHFGIVTAVPLQEKTEGPHDGAVEHHQISRLVH